MTLLVDHCPCPKDPGVRGVNGWHVERLDHTGATHYFRGRFYLEFRKKEHREPTAGERERLDAEIDDWARRYVGTDMALAPCPRYQAVVEQNRSKEKAAAVVGRRRVVLADEERTR